MIPIVMLILRVLPGETLARQRRARKLVHHAFRLYVSMMKGLGILDYKVSNLEKLEGAKLILSNHPSLIDVIFLIAFVPNANCVVKSGLLKNFFTRGPVRATGYIINDSADSVITAAAEAFASGDALIVFPEGTRTTPNQPIQLKRGAANIAIRAGADMTPVLIECTPTTLTKHHRWYHVPAKRVQLNIEVRDVIPIEPYVCADNPSMAARQLTKDLCTYFNKELTGYEQPAS